VILTLTIAPLELAVKTIDADPASWMQDAWGLRTACGTTFCVAGHIIHQSGVQEMWQHLIDTPPGTTNLIGARISGVDVPMVEQAARLILGLPDDPLSVDTGADYDLYSELVDVLNALFQAENDRSDVQHFAELFGQLIGQPFTVPLPEWAR
jgi:hypothetical protein